MLPPSEHKKVAEGYEYEHELEQVATVDVDNYHGLSLKAVLVCLSINLIAFAQILNLVGSSAYARDIAATVGGAANTVWLSQAIAILTCVVGPPKSQAADYWGRKWFIVIPTFLGMVGCIIVGRASSMHMAIAGEVVTGLAYGSQPLLYAVISEILPRRYRPVAQGGINVAIGLGGITGLLVGSTVEQSYDQGWRIFWYTTAAILGISALICAVLYNPLPRPLQTSLTTAEKVRRLDWTGYVLLAAGIVFFSIGLSWSENPFPWRNAHVLAPFLVGVVLLIALAVHQTVIRKDGMIHHELFKKDRNFAIAILCIFVEGMIFFAANNFFPFEVSVLYETKPLRTGLRFCITFFAAIVSSVGIAVYSSWTKILRGPIFVSFIAFLIFNVLMATATLSMSNAVWAYPMFLGFGLGVCLTCVVTAAQLSAPPALIAITSGLMISTRSLGGSVGLAIYNAIFNSQISTHLGPDIAAAVIPLGLSPRILPELVAALAGNNANALATLPGVTPQMIGAGIGGLQTAYLTSFRYIWVTAAVFSFLAAIASWFIINPEKDLNMHVDAPLEKE